MGKFVKLSVLEVNRVRKFWIGFWRDRGGVSEESWNNCFQGTSGFLSEIDYDLDPSKASLSDGHPPEFSPKLIMTYRCFGGFVGIFGIAFFEPFFRIYCATI